jgi:hypothetical protein
MISMEAGSHSGVTKAFARVISYLFHPLFIPVYVISFVIYELHLFLDLDNWRKKLVIIQFLVSYTLLPLLTILLMKALGFIQSIHLKTQKDRILPYVVCEIFYFWGWYVSKNLSYFPKVIIMFTLAVFLACSLGLILNSYFKISMHGIAVGTLCAFMLLASFEVHMSFGWYLSIAFLVAGLTCTARLIDSDHSNKEVYAGFFAGALMQFVAYWFV